MLRRTICFVFSLSCVLATAQMAAGQCHKQPMPGASGTPPKCAPQYYTAWKHSPTKPNRSECKYCFKSHPAQNGYWVYEVVHDSSDPRFKDYVFFYLQGQPVMRVFTLPKKAPSWEIVVNGKWVPKSRGVTVPGSQDPTLIVESPPALSPADPVFVDAPPDPVRIDAGQIRTLTAGHAPI